MYVHHALVSWLLLQEAAYMKIHAEIPDVLTKHAKPVNIDIYSSWENFLEAFLGQGIHNAAVFMCLRKRTIHKEHCF